MTIPFDQLIETQVSVPMVLLLGIGFCFAILLVGFVSIAYWSAIRIQEQRDWRRIAEYDRGLTEHHIQQMNTLLIHKGLNPPAILEVPENSEVTTPKPHRVPDARKRFDRTG